MQLLHKLGMIFLPPTYAVMFSDVSVLFMWVFPLSEVSWVGELALSPFFSWEGSGQEGLDMEGKPIPRQEGSRLEGPGQEAGPQEGSRHLIPLIPPYLPATLRPPNRSGNRDGGLVKYVSYRKDFLL